MRATPDKNSIPVFGGFVLVASSILMYGSAFAFASGVRMALLKRPA
jgi:hypothetical protein